MNEPANIPERGFYYHFKHDPDGPLNNYAYEVCGLARHTEDEGYLVIYRALYESKWIGQANYSARPIDMFTDQKMKEGVSVPRFVRITDADTIAKLTQIKQQMYP